MEQDIERFFTEEVQDDGTLGPGPQEQETEGDGVDEEESMSDEEEDEEEEEEDQSPNVHADIAVVLPRARFSGICNVETVKDGMFHSTLEVCTILMNVSYSVNFLGPRDEFVVSGSDDGNVFIWDKQTGKLCDILDGDKHVVNVIEGHPHLPLIAVSGIDTTVKVSHCAMRETFVSAD